MHFWGQNLRWGQPKVNLLGNVISVPNLVRRILDQRMHFWVEVQGSDGSTRGQFTFKCLMTTKFGRIDSLPKRNILLGSKVIRQFAKI